MVGTRPNFMKIAPIARELTQRRDAFEHLLVHTGQHYDAVMSDVFLEDLELGRPDYHLGVGAGSHAQQVARVIERLEPVILEAEPDLLLVPGDVNSTLAATLAATSVGVPVGHVEAGLRSFDRTMIEETNRVVVDSLSHFLFTHSHEANTNLVREGCDESRIHYVGNTMIDTLIRMRDRIEALDAPAELGLERGAYLVVTLHRPALVDGPLLADALRHLRAIAAQLTVVFPAHPRTRASMDALGINVGDDRLRVVEPLGYLEFLGLVAGSAGVLTDSGGIQEETTFLRVPCFTLRDTTERPITVELGTNVLLGLAPERILDVPALLAASNGKAVSIPPRWDGNAAARIVDVLTSGLQGLRTGSENPVLQAVVQADPPHLH